MATKTPDKPNTNAKPSNGKPPPDKVDKNPYLVPPAEEFWQRYSPHYEAPISGTTSVFLHVAFVFLVVGGAWLGWKFSHRNDLDFTAVRIPGGGGGNPNGVGNAPGIGGGVEDVNKDSASPDIQPLPEHVPLSADQVKEARQKFDNDPAAVRFINAGNENIEAISKLNKDLYSKLRDGLMPGKGEGGKGSGGGKDGGAGTGTGNSVGSGSGALSEREKRMLRWVMIFETQNPSDYIKQLHALGAIVAVPTGKDEYMVVDDLTARPAKLKAQDVAKLNRIYWVDDKPTSVYGVLNTLQIKQSAPHFVAFMPQELETRLGDMEQKHQGLRDDEIFETKFKVFRTNSGYDVKVQSQSRK
jgi:hypothetical protein